MLTKHKALLWCILLQMALINANTNKNMTTVAETTTLAPTSDSNGGLQLNGAVPESLRCWLIGGICLPSWMAAHIGFPCYPGCSYGCGCFLTIVKPVCPTVCTLEYRPVCGTDGVTYSNRCFLSVEACRKGDCTLRIAYVGRCRTRKTRCGKDCPAEYDPVCGTDGNTYSNACELGVAVCETGDTSVKMDHYGECGNNTEM